MDLTRSAPASFTHRQGPKTVLAKDKMNRDKTAGDKGKFLTMSLSKRMITTDMCTTHVSTEAPDQKKKSITEVNDDLPGFGCFPGGKCTDVQFLQMNRHLHFFARIESPLKKPNLTIRFKVRPRERRVHDRKGLHLN
jgi:hypothetical protein